MLPLSALVEAAQPAGWTAEHVALPIHGLSGDSRTVEKGFLFAAIPGTKEDGARFIPDALQRGAVAVLCATGACRELPEGIARIEAENPRAALARMAARFYAPQPQHVVAVTGTDGKTSTAEFVRQFWEHLGYKAATVGTLGIRAAQPLQGVAFSHTTPDPVVLHRALQQMAQQNIQHVAMETSSHGLDQRRADGVRFEAAAFTTFGSDHGDYHASPAEYFAAKARLFTELLPSGGTAVLSADDVKIAALAETCRARGHRVVLFGKHGDALRLKAATPVAEGLRVTLEVQGTAWEGLIPLYGEFQVMNILAALGLVLHAREDAKALLALLPHLCGVPGRLEKAGEDAHGAPVFVDYAHTAQALEKALGALRPHTQGKLHVVFGCGGDRDRAKRPRMGEVAARLADAIIVTDDNPRSEDPAAIRKEILATCPRAREIGERTEAIGEAIRSLRRGDVLLVAGKGHETTQIIGTRVLPHNDAEVVRGVLAAQKKEAV